MTFDIAAVYDGVVVGRPAETEIVVPAKRGEADAYEASGPALDALLGHPHDVVWRRDGVLVIADSHNGVLRRERVRLAARRTRVVRVTPAGRVSAVVVR